ncbi:MAG TPA: type II toxin-antitoxin system VapC family toxin [Desulfobulbaceae bacterium]|nr:type II toxin-antitoxin system VapC family toxin [Desulfobulbaceae bacterium]
MTPLLRHLRLESNYLSPDTIVVLPLETDVELEYARLRATLEKAGTPIGSNDLLIAAHALSTSLTMVTANEREFSRIPGLIVENWLV